MIVLSQKNTHILVIEEDNLARMTQGDTVTRRSKQKGGELDTDSSSGAFTIAIALEKAAGVEEYLRLVATGGDVVGFLRRGHKEGVRGSDKRLTARLDNHEKGESHLIVVFPLEEVPYLQEGNAIIFSSESRGGRLPDLAYPSNFLITIAGKDELGIARVLRSAKSPEDLLACLRRQERFDPEKDGMGITREVDFAKYRE